MIFDILTSFVTFLKWLSLFLIVFSKWGEIKKEKKNRVNLPLYSTSILPRASSWLQTFISQWSCQCHGARFLTEWSPYFFEFLRAKTTPPFLFFFPRASFIVEPCASLGECFLRDLLRNGILDTTFVAGNTGIFTRKNLLWYIVRSHLIKSLSWNFFIQKSVESW